MNIQREANAFLIVGHGKYHSDHDTSRFDQFVVPEGLELVLTAVPNALTSVRLGQGLVDGRECRLELHKRLDGEVVDKNYSPVLVKSGQEAPNYLLTYAKEIDASRADKVITPAQGGSPELLTELLKQVPRQSGETVKCYVACCAPFEEFGKCGGDPKKGKPVGAGMYIVCG